MNNDSPLGLQRIWWLLQELPPYAMATLTWEYAGTPARRYELMARDMPGPGRRMTCITTGTEWFINDELFATLDGEVTNYTITYGGKVR